MVFGISPESCSASSRNGVRLAPEYALRDFVGLTLNQFPIALQTHFLTRPIKVITLNDKSDTVVRYDLFERLNTGGVALGPQEIRDCVFRGQFADQLELWT
jgi:hypothetical protein